MTARGDFFPKRLSQYVRNMRYAADVRDEGYGSLDLQKFSKIQSQTAIVAADVDGIMAAQSIAAAAGTSSAVFADTYSDEKMGKFGRNVTVTASGAATSDVTVYGFDYLGQEMAEKFVLAGATTVAGKKAFGAITRVDFGNTAGVTINVGWGNVLGLPYKCLRLFGEIVDGIVPTAGTFVPGVMVPQTLTSGDPRGTWTPHTSVSPNGERFYNLQILADTRNLHGDAHVIA